MHPLWFMSVLRLEIHHYNIFVSWEQNWVTNSLMRERLRKRDRKQKYTWFLLWNISCPLAIFRPLLFSATHSYTPASSGRKYGISRTPLEWLILIFPGSGFPSALLHEMEGTGLQGSHTKGHVGHMLLLTLTRRTAAMFVVTVDVWPCSVKGRAVRC